MLKHSLLMPKDSGERTAMWMLIDQLTQNIVLKNNEEHSDPQAALLDINVERVISDIKTMENVLSRQESINSAPSSPKISPRSGHSRSLSHSYSQKRKQPQNRRKSISRKISFDSSLNRSSSELSSSGDISARNSIKRRTTAYSSYSKKKKHTSYGKKAKYVSLLELFFLFLFLFIYLFMFNFFYSLSTLYLYFHYLFFILFYFI